MNKRVSMEFSMNGIHNAIYKWINQLPIRTLLSNTKSTSFINSMLVSGPWHKRVSLCANKTEEGHWRPRSWWGRREEHVSIYRKRLSRDTRRKVHWSLSIKSSLSSLKRKLQTSACFTHGMLNIDHQWVKSCFFESGAKWERWAGVGSSDHIQKRV